MANRTIYISADGNTNEKRSLEDVHGNSYPIQIGPESIVHTKLTQLGQVPEDKQTQFALFLGADGVIKKRRLDDQLFTGKKFVTEDRWIVLTNTDNNIDINPWHQQRPYKKNTWEFKLSDKLRVKDLHVAGNLTGPNISNGDSTTVIIENPYTWNLSINGSSQAVPNTGTVNVYDGSAITIDQSGLGFVVNHADTSNYEASSYSGPWIISRIDTDTYGHVQEVTPRQLTIGDLGGPYDNYQKWQVQDISSTSYAVTSGGTLLVRGFGSTTVSVDPTSGAVDISSIDVSATPGGADTNVQYNDSGAFGGNAGLVYNKSLTSPVLTVKGTLGSNIRIDTNLGSAGIQYFKSGVQKFGFNYNTTTDVFQMQSNVSFTNPVTINAAAPVNSLDIDSAGNITSAQDIRGATLRTTDVISAGSLATDINGDIIAGTDPTGFADATTTLEIRGTSLEIEVTPAGAQDLSTDRLWQIGLPDDVTITSDLTVGNTISLPDTSSVNFGVFSIGSIDFHNSTTNINKSIFIGSSAGNFTTVTGATNIGIGSSCLPVLTSGGFNISIGSGSLISLTTGSINIAIGLSALAAATGTFNAVAIGRQAFSSSTVSDEGVAIGDLASYLSTNGLQSVAIGYQALKQDGGARNVAIGNNSGTEIGLVGAAEFLSGNDNLFLGANTRYDASAISNSTVIGAGSTVSASNTIVLGTSSQNVAIGKSTADNDLDVNGGIRAILPDATAPQLVGYDVNNDLVAVDPSSVALGPIHYNSSMTLVGSVSDPAVTISARQLNLSKSGRNVIGNAVIQLSALSSSGSGDLLIDLGLVVGDGFNIWADPDTPRQPIGEGFVYNASGGVAYQIQACRRGTDSLELSYANSGSRALLQTSILAATTEIWLTLAYASV